MKLKFKGLTAIAVFALLTSCATISRPVAVTTNQFGTKCGEATSMIYLGLFSTGGNENGIDKAAKDAGITKISHVDSYTTNYLLGIVQKQTTKVYGE